MRKCRFSIIAAAALIGMASVAGCGPSGDAANAPAKPGASGNSAGTVDNPGTASAGSTPQKANIDPSK